MSLLSPIRCTQVTEPNLWNYMRFRFICHSLYHLTIDIIFRVELPLKCVGPIDFSPVNIWIQIHMSPGEYNEKIEFPFRLKWHGICVVLFYLTKGTTKYFKKGSLILESNWNFLSHSVWIQNIPVRFLLLLAHKISWNSLWLLKNNQVATRDIRQRFCCY